MKPFRWLVGVLTLALVLGTGCAFAAPAPAVPQPRVLMISIDGLKPDYYVRADELGLKVPALRRLMASGAYARGVVGVLPTVTYPSHTTLITGVPPRVHGIVSNKVFDPEETSNEAWYWYASDIRVPTLLSAAHGRGLLTGAVSWPVTVGAPADFNQPEFWRSGSKHPADLGLIDALSSPGLLDAVARRRGKAFGYPMTDQDRTDIALYILREHRPQLLLVHLFELDFAEHDSGPLTPEALAAVEASDVEIGRLLTALEEEKLGAETLVAVVSDHGFRTVTRELRPNVLLRRAGLIELAADGKVKSWQAYFQCDGGSAALHLNKPGDAAVEKKVRALFEPLAKRPGSGVAAILEPERIAALGGDGTSTLVLDAAPGFAFSAKSSGNWQGPAKDRGYHGYAPDHPELYASLILAGRMLAAKGDLGVVPMTAIAPTLARYLGLELSPDAGRPLEVLTAP
ncbi:MAG TPA: ectonucleotide pyrophosphatase/phosphodiesterase [Thermoanaerobaculia bacterium]|nr:ectonucleotide pyrophosphatase/phosphodiesterase [Thermoanaerobaculia bacterium]